MLAAHIKNHELHEDDQELRPQHVGAIINKETLCNKLMLSIRYVI
jgi:hypothetical protein